MKQIHNVKLRMPVILPQELERKWLQEDLMDDEIKNLMMPLEDGILQAHPVDNIINKTKVDNNHAGVIEVFEYADLPALVC